MPNTGKHKAATVGRMGGTQLSPKQAKQFIGDLMVALGDETEQKLLLKDRVQSLESAINLQQANREAVERQLTEAKRQLESYREDVHELRLTNQSLMREVDQARQVRDAVKAVLEVVE